MFLCYSSLVLSPPVPYNNLLPTPSNIFASYVTSAKLPYSQYTWLFPMSPKPQLLGKEQLV